MEVKLVARTLDVFEIFARQGRPLSLTELARELDAAPSSTLALVRTLIARGYLYEPSRRGAYYPTKKMHVSSTRIDDADPVLECFRPHLSALRDVCRETVVLGQRVGERVIYLDVVASPQAIRYIAEPGDTRELHTNSIGRALFAALPDSQQRELCDDPAILQQAQRTASRGWGENVGDSVPDLAALAVSIQAAGGWYGVSIAGPIGRMQSSWEAHVQALRHTRADLQQAFALL